MKNFNKHYINGQWIEPASREYIDVSNPATEQVFEKIAKGDSSDVDKAVQAAKDAFVEYSQSSVEYRIELLKRVREGLIARREEISQLISKEMGAPITFAREAQTFTCIAHVEAIIDVLQSFNFEERDGSTLVTKEAIGVVGLITPWNWPLNQVICKVAPALAAGCTVVLKPSEIAPLDATVFAEILHEAGLPAGVFNLVNGDGPTVGDALAKHPDIQMVSFTGSTRAGIQVAISAAPTVKRVTQELGGKSANILLDDVNLQEAVATGVESCFSNSGQSCDAPTRMLVPQALYEEALQIAAHTAQGIAVGDPADPASILGPVASAVQFTKIQDLIRSGIEEGARLVAGGADRPEGLDVGYYVKPTIFGDVTPEMRVMKEEIFGPVLVIAPYASLDEAIESANSSEYGLAAYVQSTDMHNARAVARQLRAGSIYINYPEWDSKAPFGGYKMSGNGREAGKHGLAEFLEIKANVGYYPA
ncbi:aldehyde dehydrogenase family protein [Pseudomonas sp. NY15181]|uniref:aldehyde dehydrogenase family protein n=1 Tax=Pseudomonas sp. NY15181 TaxID=3400349 RepID=UPI003A89E225